MDARSSHQQIQTFSLLTLAAVAVGAALHWLSPVMVPFMLAFFLTVVLTPVVEVLHRRLKLPVLLALLVTGFLGLLGIVALGGLVAQSVLELEANSDAYVAKFKALEEDLRGMGVAEFFGIDAEPEEDPIDEEPGGTGEGDDAAGEDDDQGAPPAGVEAHENPKSLLPPAVVQNFITGAINSLMGILSQGVLVMIFMMFLVSGRAHSGTLGDVERRIKGYVMTKVVVSSITGSLTWLILTLLGVEMALVFGLFAFLLNFVPSVGSIIATLLPLPIVIIGDYSTAQQIAAIALPGVVQFGIGNLLEPRMLGDSMGLHPVTILLALIFWGMIWGFVGALLATPTTAVVRILLDKLDVTRPLADLMAGRWPGEEEAPPVESTA